MVAEPSIMKIERGSEGQAHESGRLGEVRIFGNLEDLLVDRGDINGGRFGEDGCGELKEASEDCRHEHEDRDHSGEPDSGAVLFGGGDLRDLLFGKCEFASGGGLKRIGREGCAFRDIRPAERFNNLRAFFVRHGQQRSAL